MVLTSKPLGTFPFSLSINFAAKELTQGSARVAALSGATGYAFLIFSIAMVQYGYYLRALEFLCFLIFVQTNEHHTAMCKKGHRTVLIHSRVFSR